MSTIKLFHGSKTIVEHPSLEKCRPFNDYGQAFYCTEDLLLAKEWACGLGESGIANSYTLDLAGLAVLDLNESQCSIFNWLDVLLENRIFNLSTSVMERGRTWLHERFTIDISVFDVVKGYRADDSYFGFARSFLRNEITLGQLSQAMRLGKLGQQYALRTQRAFDALRFDDWEAAEAQRYWPSRNAREDEARGRFKEVVKKDPEDGLYLSVLMAMGEEELHASLF